MNIFQPQKPSKHNLTYIGDTFHHTLIELTGMIKPYDQLGEQRTQVLYDLLSLSSQQFALSSNPKIYTIPSQALQDIKHQGYGIFPASISSQELAHARNVFDRFLEQSTEEKQQYQHIIQHIGREKGYIGWKEKKEIDHKQYFHYSPVNRYVFDHITSGVKDDFFALAEHLYQICYFQSYALISALHKQYPHYNLLETYFPSSYHIPSSLLRWVKYDHLGTEQKFTQPHTDRWGGTIHLGSSHQGLRIGHTKETLHTCNIPHEHMLFFPGEGLQKISQHSIPATYHDVIQEKTTGNTRRYALVFFIEAPTIVGT